jgi:hypothetical protein
MFSRFGPRYAAADAWASTCSATRQEGESCLAALQCLDEIQQVSLLLGLPAHICPIEKQCYQLQRLLSSEEKRVWSAAANALAQVSDDAIRALEVTAAAAALATTGRQSLGSSVPIDERESAAGLLVCTTPCTSVDISQGPTRSPVGGRPTATSPGSSHLRGSRRHTHHAPPSNALVYPTPGPTNAYDSCSRWKCRGGVVYCRPGELRDGCNETEPVQPPAYEGNNPTKATANQAEFNKRKACGACYHCPMKGPGKVNNAIFHTQCPTHGRSSTLEDRRDPAKRVVGSSSTF